LAVKAARTLLNLPYYSASMQVSVDGTMVKYHSRRHRASASAEFQAQYMPTGPVFAAREGSLEHFLTERYCLYQLDHHGAPYRLEIHHPRWPLQPAEADLVRNSMATANAITLPAQATLLHYAKRLDMVAWLPDRLTR